MKKPNILVVIADQMRADCTGRAGRKVSTPHIDLLASEGTAFDLCITPNVVCQPARASLITGLLPKTNGVYDNGIDLDDDLGARGIGGSLTAAGYDTGYIGKAHFKTIYTFNPTGSQECLQSMPNYPADWHGPYMGFDYVELVVEGHNRRPPQVPPNGQHYENWFYSDGRGDLKNSLHRTKLRFDSEAPQTWNSALPTAWHNSTWVADRTLDFLKDAGDKPFCLWASFPDPHSPFDAPAPWCFLHELDQVDLPKERKLSFDRRPFWHAANMERPTIFADKRLSNDADVQSRLGKTPDGYTRLAPQDDYQMRHTIANYYGMISLVDHNVGRILAGLETLGLAEDTYVIFCSDHGEWLGDHGLIQKGPMMYDGLLRVPFIMKGPGVPVGKVVNEPISLIDVAPTLYEVADAEPLGEVHGSSVMPLLDGGRREFALNEWDLEAWRYGVSKPLELRTVRTKRYRMTVDLVSGEGELYDFEQDPNENSNLFNKPAYEAVQQRMLSLISSRPNDEMNPPLARVGL